MKYLSGLSTFAFTTCLLLFLLPGHALAAAGDLDPTYGSGGAVVTEFPGERGGIADAAVQPDGKLVVGGVVAPRGGRSRTVVARYRLNGSLDQTFGASNGVASSPFDISPSAVAVQSDGKVIVAGVGQGDLPFAFTLFRLNPDGSPDTTFGSGGLATADFLTESSINDIVLQPDGKIVAVGDLDFSSRLPLARFNPNGSLDVTFGSGGKATPDMGAFARAWAVTIQPDGKIVAAGDVGLDFAVARFNPDGKPDQSFGVGGKVVTDMGGEGKASGVALQPDGKIVAVGYDEVAGFFKPVVARYNGDGSRDTTFGVNGTVVLDAQSSTATSLVILGDGRIFVAWASFGGDNAPWRDFNLLGLDPDGRIVSMVPTDFGATESPAALVLQPDGKLVAAGVTYTESSSKFALVRYLTSLTGAPVLQTEAGTNRAVALDSVTLARDPFTVHTEHNFAPDRHTRLLLFATLLDLLPGEGAPAVSAQAEDSQGRVFPLAVEQVGRVPGFEWLTQVSVRLPDELEAAGDVQVSVSLRGAASNKAVITIAAADR